eukprot:3523679-Lingulodinium_polyedra.AAC.1
MDTVQSKTPGYMDIGAIKQGRIWPFCEKHPSKRRNLRELGTGNAYASLRVVAYALWQLMHLR